MSPSTYFYLTAPLSLITGILWVLKSCGTVSQDVKNNSLFNWPKIQIWKNTYSEKNPEITVPILPASAKLVWPLLSIPLIQKQQLWLVEAQGGGHSFPHPFSFYLPHPHGTQRPGQCQQRLLSRSGTWWISASLPAQTPAYTNPFPAPATTRKQCRRYNRCFKWPYRTIRLSALWVRIKEKPTRLVFSTIWQLVLRKSGLLSW